jgi:hypothetical protein
LEQPGCGYCGHPDAALYPSTAVDFPICVDCFATRVVPRLAAGSPVDPPDPDRLAAYRAGAQLAVEMGMPPAMPWRLLGYTGEDLARIDAEWGQFRVEIFGDARTILEFHEPDRGAVEEALSWSPSRWRRLSGAERRRLAPKVDFPIAVVPDHEPPFVRVWRATLTCQDVPGRLRMEWDPKGNESETLTVNLAGLGKRDAEVATSRLQAGRVVLGTVVEAPGGRPRDDTDLEEAIRAISHAGEDPTPSRVAAHLYGAATRSTSPYDSLYKRLHGRDGRPFSDVFAEIKARALG